MERLTMAKPEIVRMLVISTAHLPLEVCRELDERDTVALAGAVVYPFEYGAFVYASEEPGEDCPPYLAAAISRARALRCGWIKYDADGEILDGLETFDHSGADADSRRR
jgi:ADP-glucose pyrophosphorylase